MRDRPLLLDDPPNQFEPAMDRQPGISVRHKTSVRWALFLDSSTPRTEVFP